MFCFLFIYSLLGITHNRTCLRILWTCRLEICGCHVATTRIGITSTTCLNRLKCQSMLIINRLDSLVLCNIRWRQMNPTLKRLSSTRLWILMRPINILKMDLHQLISANASFLLSVLFLLYVLFTAFRSSYICSTFFGYDPDYIFVCF